MAPGVRLWAVKILDDRRQRPAVLVRLRPRLDRGPARPVRRVASAVRGGEHERREVGHRRRRLRRGERRRPPRRDLPARRQRRHRRRRGRERLAGTPPSACRRPTTRSSPSPPWPTPTASPAASAATAATRWGGYDVDDTFADFTQLRPRRRPDRPGQVHLEHQGRQHLRLVIGHLDGGAPRGRRGRALQGQPTVGHPGRGEACPRLPRLDELVERDRPRRGPGSPPRCLPDRPAWQRLDVSLAGRGQRDGRRRHGPGHAGPVPGHGSRGADPVGVGTSGRHDRQPRHDSAVRIRGHERDPGRDRPEDLSGRDIHAQPSARAGTGRWRPRQSRSPSPVRPSPASSGSDRYATAAAISAGWGPGVPVVYIATGLNFPDALAGAAAAGTLGAPLLLVTGTTVPPRHRGRAGPPQARPDRHPGWHRASCPTPSSTASAPTPAVASAASSGSDRYATAAAISAGWGPGVPVVYIATGLNFPDALAGAAAAGTLGAPLLLVTGTTVPAATAAELARLQPGRIVILGGTGRRVRRGPQQPRRLHQRWRQPPRRAATATRPRRRSAPAGVRACPSSTSRPGSTSPTPSPGPPRPAPSAPRSSSSPGRPCPPRPRPSWPASSPAGSSSSAARASCPTRSLRVGRLRRQVSWNALPHLDTNHTILIPRGDGGAAAGVLVRTGVPGRIRTCDPRVRSSPLCPLSYGDGTPSYRGRIPGRPAAGHRHRSIGPLHRRPGSDYPPGPRSDRPGMAVRGIDEEPTPSVSRRATARPIDAPVPAPTTTSTATQLALELAARAPGLALAPEWKDQQRLWGHPFHPMCSYLASFPAALAHAFIARYSRPGDVVLDPFSGRGTTPLQACAEGRIGVGNDLNPFAHLLTAAKVEPADAGPGRDPARPAAPRLGRRSPAGSRSARACRRPDRRDAAVPRAGSAGRRRRRRSRSRPRSPSPSIRGRSPSSSSSGPPSTSTTATDRFLAAAITGILHGKSASLPVRAHAEHVQHGAALRPRLRRPDGLRLAGARRLRRPRRAKLDRLFRQPPAAGPGARPARRRARRRRPRPGRASRAGACRTGPGSSSPRRPTCGSSSTATTTGCGPGSWASTPRAIDAALDDAHHRDAVPRLPARGPRRPAAGPHRRRRRRPRHRRRGDRPRPARSAAASASPSGVWEAAAAPEGYRLAGVALDDVAPTAR